jgi:hypothetical protein
MSEKKSKISISGCSLNIKNNDFEKTMSMLLEFIYNTMLVDYVIDLETNKKHKNYDIGDIEYPIVYDERAYYKNNVRKKTRVPEEGFEYHFIFRDDDTDLKYVYNRCKEVIESDDDQDIYDDCIVPIFNAIKKNPNSKMKHIQFRINKNITFYNKTGVNDDIRGSNNMELLLKFCSSYDLDRVFTMHDLCSALHHLKSHKLDNYHELYSNIDIEYIGNTYHASLRFEHGS